MAQQAVFVSRSRCAFPAACEECSAGPLWLPRPSPHLGARYNASEDGQQSTKNTCGECRPTAAAKEQGLPGALLQ